MDIPNAILKAICDASGYRGNKYVADEEIVQRTGLSLDLVKDFLTELESWGYVQLSHRFGDRVSAITTAQGRLRLLDLQSMAGDGEVVSVREAVQEGDAVAERDGEVYVDLGRLDELRGITSGDFDLNWLIELCEELNVCYANECYLAVAALVRTILNHVPPIFGQKTFAGVISQYGGKSFKEMMDHLDKSLRPIADESLHKPIARKHALPNRTTVDFGSALDRLLQEVIERLS